ncbi:DUF349 domain-containing protein [Cellulomonas aerilata]|uniref:ATPase n=1 Tax=Cellulomonas aerilata TaxID=515326 RepID=A0A512DAV2_9CELL|nr:hypothetical protein CAE01nite_10950 [Cellulomonas aerilata]
MADAAPADDAAPVADAAPADDAAPVADAAPVEDAVTADDAAPVADAVTTDDAAPVSDAAPAADLPAEAAPVDTAPEADAPAADVPADAAPTDAPPADTADDSTADAAAEVSADAAPSGAAPAGSPVPAPTPSPVPRPTPRPIPRPVPRVPHGPAAAVPGAAPAAPVAPPQDAAEAALAATFGRVDEEGTVFVREGEGERAVGQFPGASAEEALSLYVRRFLDLQAKVVLFETRLATTELAQKEVEQTLTKLSEELADPAAVGDLAGLRGRLGALRAVAAERRAAADAERAAAKEVAVAARTAIVEQAEKIAATDPERIQWRPAGEQLRVLLDQWKDAQRNGPRIDRPTEESLWKRFSHARTTFDRERRHFFAELESRNASARAAKEQLVAQAERLSTSTDWGTTAGAYRDLMAQWKASGRASRKEDDALWARFRAAQDAFFSARDAASAETDAEFRGNLEVKEALLVEAERLVPITDLAAAKAALRSIQDRWDAAGKVPRGDLQRVEARLRAVESAVRDADQSAWTRGNPETRARAEGAAAQLEAAIVGLEADLATAQAAGNARKIAEAQAALDARRAWLEQVRRAAQSS